MDTKQTLVLTVTCVAAMHYIAPKYINADPYILSAIVVVVILMYKNYNSNVSSELQVENFGSSVISSEKQIRAIKRIQGIDSADKVEQLIKRNHKKISALTRKLRENLGTRVKELVVQQIREQNEVNRFLEGLLKESREKSVNNSSKVFETRTKKPSFIGDLKYNKLSNDQMIHVNERKYPSPRVGFTQFKIFDEWIRNNGRTPMCKAPRSARKCVCPAPESDAQAIRISDWEQATTVDLDEDINVEYIRDKFNKN